MCFPISADMKYCPRNHAPRFCTARLSYISKTEKYPSSSLMQDNESRSLTPSYPSPSPSLLPSHIWIFPTARDKCQPIPPFFPRLTCFVVYNSRDLNQSLTMPPLLPSRNYDNKVLHYNSNITCS